eukprot:2076769-Rhodomonas_salina.1
MELINDPVYAADGHTSDPEPRCAPRTSCAPMWGCGVVVGRSGGGTRDWGGVKVQVRCGLCLGATQRARFQMSDAGEE